MAKKSKLLAALDAHKGRDFKLEKQKKLQKQADKRKKSKSQPQQLDTGAEQDDTVVKSTLNGISQASEIDSEGWESEEDEETTPITVGSSSAAIYSPTKQF